MNSFSTLAVRALAFPKRRDEILLAPAAETRRRQIRCRWEIPAVLQRGHRTALFRDTRDIR